MCEIKWRKSAKPTFTQLSQNVTDAALWIMPKKTFFNPAQLRSTAAVMIIATFSHNILGYSDAAQLQRRSTDAVMELVLRCCVYWPNRLGWRQKVLQPPSTFMILSWWCPLGHWKWHLPAIQFILAVRLILILTRLSSRWTVPLNEAQEILFWWRHSMMWSCECIRRVTK